MGSTALPRIPNGEHQLTGPGRRRVIGIEDPDLAHLDVEPHLGGLQLSLLAAALVLAIAVVRDLTGAGRKDADTDITGVEDSVTRP
ncbi:hypothetical protein [Streptomyces peucetius]